MFLTSEILTFEFNSITSRRDLNIALRIDFDRHTWAQDKIFADNLQLLLSPLGE